MRHIFLYVAVTNDEHNEVDGRLGTACQTIHDRFGHEPIPRLTWMHTVIEHQLIMEGSAFNDSPPVFINRRHSTGLLLRNLPELSVK